MVDKEQGKLVTSASVSTYNIKAADGQKKVRCVCDGSTQSGKAHILAEMYANCVDQTSAHLFYTHVQCVCRSPPPKTGDFTSGLIVRSTNGGSSIKVALQSPPVMLS